MSPSEHSDSHKTKQAWKQAEVFTSYPVKRSTGYIKYFSMSICVHKSNNSTPCTSLGSVCLGNGAATKFISLLKEKFCSKLLSKTRLLKVTKPWANPRLISRRLSPHFLTVKWSSLLYYVLWSINSYKEVNVCKGYPHCN